MTKEEIKQEYESLYKTIERSEERLTELRSVCKHEDRIKGSYSYRPGNITSAIICAHCNEILETPEYKLGDTTISITDLI